MLLGAALYLGALARQPAGPEARAGRDATIRVPARVITRAREEWTRREGAAPDPSQTRAAVEPFVREELLYREALALGLDRGDLIVRRRLVQKMRFVIEELAVVPEPSDAQLAAWVGEHAERYRQPARVSLEHHFFARDGRTPAALEDAAAAALGALRAGEAGARGDSFVHGRSFTGRSEAELRRVFGPEFAAAALALEPGAWSGPIASSYGLHLVRVTQRDAERAARLEDVREAARADWRAARREQAQEEELLRRLARYEVLLAEDDASGASG